MTMLTVTEDANGERGMKALAIQEVLYLTYDRRAQKLLVHTAAGRYYMPGTIKYWETCLESSGHKFCLVDRGTIVNAENVTYVHKLFKVAYFEERPSRKSPKCDISHNRFEEIVCKLETINDNIQCI